MARYIKTIKTKPGIAPGTLMYHKEHETFPVKISCYKNIEGKTQQATINIDEVLQVAQGSEKFWINISGTIPLDWLEKFGKTLGIHHLTLEDIISENQRPKLEIYDNYQFISLKMLYKTKGKRAAILEELSILHFPNGVITFQTTDVDAFDGIRNRLNNEKARIYKLNSDYTVFCLLDTIVDHYMDITETVGQRIDKLEDQLFGKQKMHSFIEKFTPQQRELNILRKNIRPVKELMVQCLKQDNTWISNENIPYFNDVNDHLLLVNETIDAYRDLLSDLLNIHSTHVGNSMNEVMKTLTIFSAIFIPTTFIAGVYGTNFEYLPELGFKYSYHIFWLVMIAVATTMLIYFKRKNWF